MRLESTLHYFSAIISSEIISIFDAAWNLDNEAVLPLALSVVEVLRRLLDVMTTRSSAADALWKYVASSIRFLARVGIVIAVDMMPIAMHFGGACFSSTTDLVLLWQQTLQCALATCVDYAECIEWEHIEPEELSSHFSVIAFRTKQDHIGSVSVMRLLLPLKNVATHSAVQQQIMASIVTNQTPFDDLEKALCSAVDGSCDAASLIATDIGLLLSCIPQITSAM
jgi:hypothetical protein